MIKIRIRNDDHEIDLQFPISENKLYAKLAEIHAIEGKDGLTLNMQKKVLLILRYSATSEKRTFRSSLQLSKISKKA